MRVLVCDSVPVVRDGLKTLFESVADVTDVAVTGSAVEGLIMARRTDPDVVITDLHPDGMDGMEFIHRLLHEDSREAQSKIVVFTSDITDRTVETLLKAGVRTLIEKETRPEQVLMAVRAAARGEVTLAPSVTGRLVGWFRSQDFGPDPEPDPQVESLTPREREVLLLVGEGRSVEEIATYLVIGVATVRTHIYRLRHKLGVRDRAQLVSFVFSSGLL
ncbi:response regulator transcription factor [Streptomyces sp. NBC_01497]|uniref:response regulator transcription factor n=1 Tax=Streptomyces sp. NBC_01497 TaxID=2903885 RepID=UPI002E34AD85|nr:response regulator transcription factor [Streptomyces sp. NBC_01497]